MVKSLKSYFLNSYFLLVFPPFFWALNWVIARAMRFEIEPIAMSVLRWSGALLLILPFSFKEIISKKHIIKKNLKILIILGILGTITFNTAVYVGLKFTTVINGSLINTLIPIFIVFLSLIFLKEKLNFNKFFGLMLSLFGALYLILNGNYKSIFSLKFNKGDLWLVFAMFIWAVYTIIVKNKPKELSSVCFLSITITFGLPFIVPFFLWEINNYGLFEISSINLLVAGYFAIFPSIISYLIWNRGVAAIGAAKAGVYTYLLPVFGIVLSIIFLNEQLYLYHLYGAIPIILGIYLVTKKNEKHSSQDIT